MKTTILMAIMLSLASISALADSEEKGSDSNLPRFFEVVATQIFRGGQPNDQGLIELAQMKMKTILDLRDEKDLIPIESAKVRKLGLNFISVPLSAWQAPKDSDIALILSALNKVELRPIFIHCQHGQDRTGLVVGLFRFFDQNVAASQAYAEMKSKGFHSILHALTNYFFLKTGLGFDEAVGFEKTNLN